jgi:hypothetical protein
MLLASGLGLLVLSRRRWLALAAAGAAASATAARADDRAGVSARVRRILDRMDATPSPRPEGWELGLNLDAKVYRPGQDIPCTLEFRNLSRVAGRLVVTHWEQVYWLEVEPWGGHSPEPGLTAEGRRVRERWNDGKIDHRYWVTVEPGGQHREGPMKLNHFYDFDPGYYRVRITYYEEHSRDGTLKLVSDWARFRIAAE